MSRIKDRQKAIELRKQGKTYSQIRKALDVSKSTLSDWLSEYQLTDEQMKYLQKERELSRQLAIEKTRIIKQKKRENRIKKVFEEQKAYWRKLSKRELELAGIFLYWGEGNKRLNGSVSLNNTDPMIMKFTLYWLRHGLKIPLEKVKAYLHLYSDMNVEEEISFWSNELNLSPSQFRRPYIKASARSDIDQKGFGHGTCGLVVNDVRLKEKIIMSIKTFADYYGERV